MKCKWNAEGKSYLPRGREPRAAEANIVFADDDGCVFAVADRIDDLLPWRTKLATRTAEAIKSGRSLWEQLEFARISRTSNRFELHIP